MLFSRWTTDWDCQKETAWWYVIKDTPFDINQLKAKRRYEINKGKKNFEVRRINADEYADDLLHVQVEAFSAYPEKYRPHINEAAFKNGIKNWDCNVVYGGFNRENSEMCAYAVLSEYEDYLEFSVLKAIPLYEKLAINAAMVMAIIEDYNDRLGNGFYINDGSRSIRHETAFQNYLEKYFGFRKAYCILNIDYSFPMLIAVKLLYPFRKHISKDSKWGSLVSSVLIMEEISRGFQ